MNQLKTELTFLRALVALNLASAMEYRVSFISRMVGMFVNNGIFFLFWLIFFEQFGEVRGYGMQQMYLLYAVVTLGFGIAFTLAANTTHNLAALIAQGRLDYYLVFPRNLLLHVIASRMAVSAIGDAAFGIIAYLFTGLFHPVEIVLFLLAALLVAAVFVSFSVLSGSLAFYMGNAQYTSQQLHMSMTTLSLYPSTLFSGFSRVLLYTLIPAAFVGAVPVQLIEARSWLLLLGLAGAAALFVGSATAVFYHGLRRYESGSAINVNV